MSSVICPTSSLRGCSPLHHSPYASNCTILITLPFSRPPPGPWGFEGSKAFLMQVERLPCAPPAPVQPQDQHSLSGSSGGPFLAVGHSDLSHS